MASTTLEVVSSHRSALAPITAKISAEVLPAHAVPRPRLVDLLMRRDWRIASITAGPGLGKSVLLLQWLATLPPDSYAVVALDEADNAPERFWRYVVGSLERARPEAFAGSANACATACSSELLIAQVLEDAAALERDLVLAIEDLHTVRNRTIIESLAQLLEHLPRPLRVVFTSRQDVALPRARWRARSWLVDVREADLAFTKDETERLFDALDEDRLSTDEISRLTTVTEGWVAALQLAALAMRDNDPSHVVEDFCGRSRMIADYFGTEVIDRQSEEMRNFMSAIAVADSFDAELCDLLTGRNDSGERLEELAGSTHFLVAVDDAGSTYRYHHLLRDVLRSQLARRHPSRYSHLHGVVAEIFEHRGEGAAAAVHFVEAGDYDRAFGLVFGSAYELWERGDIDTLRTKLEVFPVEYIDASPHRMLVYAFVLVLCSSFDEGRVWMERAEKALAHQVSASHDDDLTMLDAMRVLAFNVDGREVDSIDRGRRALARVEAGSDIGTLGVDLRQHVARAELLTDDTEAARTTLSADTEGGSVSQTVRALALWARISLREGCLHAAADRARRACTAAAAFDIPDHVVTIDAHLATLGVLLDRNEIAATAEPIEAIHQLLERSPLDTYRVLVQLEEVRITVARDGIDAALDLLRDVRASIDLDDRPGLSHRVTALEARLRIDADEIRRARLLVERLPRRWAPRRLLDARLLLASDRPLEARAVVEKAGFACIRDRLEGQLILVRSSLAAGTEVEPHLSGLLDLAAPERFVRAVLDEGPVVARLVRRCAETADRVEADRFAVELGAPRRAATLAASDLVVPLSARERDVLRFLPSRLTTREIASECFMSVNTVKAHLKRIYRKLGVGTRAEAVERAVLLGELRG
jgi:LuxR family maltose regulon positive regulatory protein